MERIEALTIQEEVVFPKKKKLTENFNKCVSNLVRVITNFTKYQFPKQIKTLCMLGVSVEPFKLNDEKTESDEILKNFQIKVLLNKNFIQLKLKEYFTDYLLSGNTIFALLKEEANIQNEIKFLVKYFEGEATLVSDLEIEAMRSSGIIETHLYIVKIIKSDELSNFKGKLDNTKNDLHIIRFWNIYLHEIAKKIGIKKTNVRHVFDDLEEKDLIPQNYKNPNCNIFFYESIKMNSVVCKGDNVFLRIVPRFRMLRYKTYFDYFKDLYDNYNGNQQRAENQFIQDCQGKTGLTTYSKDRIKIDEIIFEDPINISFDKSSEEKINLNQYYKEKYGRNLKPGIQPILIEKRKVKQKDSNERIEKPLHFIADLVFIAGKFDHEKSLKLDSITHMQANEKFCRFNKVMEKIAQYSQNLNNEQNSNKARDNLINQSINFKPVEIETPILKPPVIRFGNKKVKPDEKGEISIQQIEPEENLEIENPLVLLVDVDMSDAKYIYDRLREATETLNMKIPPIPIVREIIISNNMKVKEYFETYLEEVYLGRKENKIDFIIMIINKFPKITNIYSEFKTCLEESKLRIPSQVLVKEKATEAKNLSYFTFALFQVWAKRDLCVWKIAPVDKELQKKLVIVAYSITFNPNNQKFLTSLCISINDRDCYLCNYKYYSQYSDGGNRYMSTILGDLLVKALRKFIKEMKEVENWEVDQIILYKDGLNENQRQLSVLDEKMQIDLALKNEKLQGHFADTKICMIHVNPNSDLKIFAPINKSAEGLENSQYLNHETQVEYAPVGTFINEVVVSIKIPEFYIKSAATRMGSPNITQYILSYDDTNLSLDFIIKLTYNFCYLYYNNNKSVKMPAPLFNVVRRNKYIVNYITRDLPKSENNISL